MGSAFLALFLAYTGLLIYRRKNGVAAQRAMDRTFGRQAANVRATWPILAFIVGINLMSLVIMFFLVTPEPVQIIAVLSFAGSAVAGMGYVTYVLLNGLFGSR